MDNLSSQNREQLQKLRIRTLQRALVHGVALWLIPVLVGALLMVWSLSWETAPDSWKYLLTLTAYLVGVVLLGRNLVWRPLSPLLNNRKFAVHLSKDAGLGHVLAVMEESVRLPDKWRSTDPVNVTMREKLHRESARIMGQQSAEKILPLPNRWRGYSLLILVAAIGLFWVNQSPMKSNRGWMRLWHPLPGSEIVYTSGIYVKGETLHVAAGSSVELQGVDLSGGQGVAWCEIRRGQGQWQRFDASAKDVSSMADGLLAPYHLWVSEQTNVLEDFDYRFGRGTIVSQAGRVNVHHHPLVAILSGSIVPPKYTRLPRQKLDRVPTWLDVPEGSRLYLEGTLNHAVQKAELVFSSGDTLAMATDGRKITVEFAARNSLTFHLSLLDSFGLTNEASLLYEVVATEDQVPDVGLYRLDDDGALPLSGILDLMVEAADDFGIEKASLLVRAHFIGDEIASGDDSFFSMPFGPEARLEDGPLITPFGKISLEAEFVETATATRLAVGLKVDTGRLDLVAGDKLEFKVQVADNRRPLPRGVGESEILKLVVPAAAEALAEQAENQKEHRSEMEEVRKRGNQLGKDLDRLTRELMKNPIPDWARQKEMEAAIKRQQALQEELARVAQQLQQELDALAQSQLTSERLMDKADQVSELLSSEAGDQVKDLLEKMDEAAGKVSPEEVAKAMEEVARDQKEMARRLDAALAMLNKMEQEQELEGMVALLEKTMAKQQELADLSREMAEEQEKSEGQKGDSSEKSDAEKQEQAEELARRQEALEKEMDQLKEKMQETLDDMAQQQSEGKEQDPSDQEMAKALEQAMEKMEEQQSEENMKKAAEMLENMDPGKAAEMQQQALRDLGSLYHVLLETQSAMEMAMEQKQVASLRKLASDLLTLSQRQEEISQSIPLQLREVRTKTLNRSQHRLQKSTIRVRSDLAELSGEAPMRIMKLLKSLDGLLEIMGNTVQNMEDNRGQNARRNASAALAEINSIVINLLTEAQMAGSGSGGGNQPQPSPGEQLKEMLMQQAKLNGMTEQLREMLANRGICQATRAQMKRLGDKQGELAGKIKELAEEERATPDGARLLGDMESLGQEMESVGQDLDSGLVSEETLIRQERILSKMLAARNAARRRDYSSKRESNTAGRTFANQKGRSSDLLDGDEDNPFAKRYVPLEKAPAEFRELVRRYFQALEKMGRKEEVVP